MHVAYIDEVKNDPTSQPFYWLCALVIADEVIVQVENAVNEIARGYFGTELLSRDTEFHAVAIVQGKANFKGAELSARVDLMKSLTSVISDFDSIFRIQVRLDPRRMSRTDHAKIGFMYLVERIDDVVRRKKDVGLLIADHDKEFASVNVRSLSSYRVHGTEFEYGRDIRKVVDTVHHTDSSHSRLIQLADVYAYSCALANQDDLKGHRAAIVDHLRGLPNFLWPSKFKHWPPE